MQGLAIHGFRHTAASLYISSGTPPKVVQRILGHGSVMITMDLYGHLYPDEMVHRLQCRPRRSSGLRRFASHPAPAEV
ncbi:tyrosine-type recombinase/integrase [Actinopolymorpha singaporensis]